MPLHWPELVLLLVAALVIFGPKRLPEIGSSIGKTIKEFQRSMKEVNEPATPPTPTLPVADAPRLPGAQTPTASESSSAMGAATPDSAQV